MSDETKKPASGTFAKLMTPPEPKEEQPGESRSEAQQESNQARKKPSQQDSDGQTNHANNMTILQSINEDDIENLRDPAYKAQTYRLTEKDLEWVRDTAYQLSKEISRGKVAQTDIVRISLVLFRKVLSTNKAGLKELLEKIK